MNKPFNTQSQNPVEEKPHHPHDKKQPGEDVNKPIQEDPGNQNTG